MCETTFTPGARQAISAVKTGMPAALASWMAGPIARESQGQSTIGRDLLDDEVLDLILLPGHVEVAADDDRRRSRASSPSAVKVSPITLKNGLVSVSTETPIVPLLVD